MANIIEIIRLANAISGQGDLDQAVLNNYSANAPDNNLTKIVQQIGNKGDDPTKKDQLKTMVDEYLHFDKENNLLYFEFKPWKEANKDFKDEDYGTWNAPRNYNNLTTALNSLRAVFGNQNPNNQEPQVSGVKRKNQRYFSNNEVRVDKLKTLIKNHGHKDYEDIPKQVWDTMTPAEELYLYSYVKGHELEYGEGSVGENPNLVYPGDRIIFDENTEYGRMLLGYGESFANIFGLTQEKEDLSQYENQIKALREALEWKEQDIEWYKNHSEGWKFVAGQWKKTSELKDKAMNEYKNDLSQVGFGPSVNIGYPVSEDSKKPSYSLEGFATIPWIKDNTLMVGLGYSFMPETTKKIPLRETKYESDPSGNSIFENDSLFTKEEKGGNAETKPHRFYALLGVHVGGGWYITGKGGVQINNYNEPIWTTTGFKNAAGNTWDVNRTPTGETNKTDVDAIAGLSIEAFIDNFKLALGTMYNFNENKEEINFGIGYKFK